MAKAEQQWQSLIRHRELLVYSILLVICVASIAPIIVYLSPRVLPWWTDGGTWLKQLNAMFGIEYPMWGLPPFQFDQLYLVYLAFLRALLGNGVSALEASALSMYAALVGTTFVLARRLFKSEVAALAAALLSGFHPIFYETLGWGGYPNLFGYALLPLAFYSMLNSIERGSRKHIAFAALTVAAVAFSHNLTAMIFTAVLGVWLILLIGKRVILRSTNMAKDFHVVTLAIAVMLSAYAVQMFVFGFPRYDYFNEAAFYNLRIGLADLVWAVKNQTVAFSLIFATAASFIVMKFRRLTGIRSSMLAMVSWILAPLLMSQLYLIGLAFDYRRAFLFAIQPSLIMAMAPLALLGERIPKSSISAPKIRTSAYVRKAVRALPKMLIILLSLSILVSQVETGALYIKVVDDWYHHIDLYGNQYKMDALQWIGGNTPTSAVFVAEEPFARWVEGLASRRTLTYVSPEYLFIKGESERSLAARAVLECEVELRNDLIRVCDQYPYGNYTPSISFMRQGIYDDIFYINSLESKLYLSNGAAEWFERLGQNASSSGTYSLSLNSKSAVYKTLQSYNDLTMASQIVVNSNHEQAVISYTASTNDPNVKLLNFTIPLFSAEGVGFDEVEVESINQIHVRSGAISFDVSLGGDIEGAQFVCTSGADKMLLDYMDHSGPSGRISATVTISSDEKATTSEGLVARSWQDIVRQFDISYVVIPRITEISPSGMIPIRLLSLPLYNHLLEDTGLKVAYENPNVIILLVVCCQSES
jgi:hypothetical protein